MKKATGADTSSQKKVAKKVDLYSLKSKVDTLDVDKLKAVSSDLTDCLFGAV